MAKVTTPMEGERLIASNNPPNWGNIDEVLNAPLGEVSWDASWISVIGMWLTLPFNLIAGAIAGLVKCIFVNVSIGCCCCFCPGGLQSVLQGRPLYLAYTWWRYVFAGLTALLANGKSRLALFIWEWEAFGEGKYWWHGEGAWVHTYDDCRQVLRSQQPRQSAFGAIKACVPDLFATNILIFLPNTGSTDSEWASLRRGLHQYFLDVGMDVYKQRTGELNSRIAAEWPAPKLEDLNEKVRLQKLVSKCIFFVMFGIWLEDSEAKMLTAWRTGAIFFILPRLVQRVAFNLGINKIKALRRDTVGLIEKYNLQGLFVNMNESLGKYRRSIGVKLCDEIMYVIGFAGIGGTCAASESVACFLQNLIPEESAAKHISWGAFDTQAKMVAEYKRDPEKYIRETCRMDPPVTSATSAFKEATRVTFAGKEFDLPAGTLNQYVLSMANRDKAVFATPEVFNPDRANLNQAFTWNGAFGAQDEADYPRICPGRYLSLDVVMAITNHAIGHTSKLGVHKGALAP